MRRPGFYVVWVFVTLCWATIADADIANMLERSLMPGKLAKVHTKFAEDCNNCHVMFDKGAQNRLCVDCHDHRNIRNDLLEKRGYHGKNETIRKRDCRECHREHLGEDNQALILLDERLFNHDDTDFPLNRTHAFVECDACHKKGKKYHEAKYSCAECHKEQDAHDGYFGNRCQDCHVDNQWRIADFQHDKTKFTLKDSHRLVACASCHPANRYTFEKVSCHSCHEKTDVHRGRMGTKCDKCHKEDAWGKIRFDHDKDTKFDLNGKHKSVACENCHVEDAYEVSLKKTCVSCHDVRDKHLRRFGKKCETCHSPRAWDKQKFEHETTGFELTGKHKDIDCSYCHVKTGKLYSLPADCYSCHRAIDVHDKELGKRCQQCHSSTQWIDTVKFDHGLTDFPLVGVHQTVMCEQCHKDQKYVDTEHKCKGCHKDPEVHEKLFGDKCADCHLVADWKAWKFDHNRQTDFELKGKHKKQTCYACHLKGSREIDDECVSCHLQNDMHDGQFGSNCGNCHNEKTFKEVQFD
ncbi:MAG: cytochrome C [Gammaproteobacteria bacterium]|nr:cytochrome C [Gammaproteobacteria bacterium]